MPFPDSLSVAVLNTTHPTYDRCALEDLWTLYRNRPESKESAKRFLRKRAFEADDLYEERLDRFVLCSYLGEITDFFVAGLFLDAPDGLVEDDETAADGDFWKRFFSNADHRGTDLQRLMRNAWVRALVFARSYLWVDLPALPPGAATPETRADQDALKVRDAYVVPLANAEVLDWEEDDRGDFMHVWLRHVRLVRPSPTAADRLLRFTWTLLTRSEFARYQIEVTAVEKNGEWVPKDGPEAFAKLSVPRIAEGTHTFERVPVLRLELPEGLQLGPKIENMQRHLIEVDNGIAWKHSQGNYAMPVVKSDQPFQQTLGESYFIQLGAGDSFDWSEPAGATLSLAQEQREKVKAELFRISHQMAASVGAEASTAGRSGESKRRDMTPTLVVLTALGEIARDFYGTVLETVAAGRGDATDDDAFMVAGFSHFDIEELGDFLDSVIKARTVNIPSPTFQRKLAKKVANRMLPEVTPAEAEAIGKEIDAAPEEAFASTYDPANPGGNSDEDAA